MADIMDIYVNQYNPVSIERDRRLDAQPGFSASAWYHPDLNKTSEICDLQRLTEDVIGLDAVEPPRRRGFKEVRFSIDLLDAMISTVFPCARFIINIREDIQTQHHSQFKKHLSLDELQHDNDALVTWASVHSNQSFVLPLEHFSVDSFNAVLRWLGIFGCSFTTVVHSNDHHSYNGGPDPDTNVLDDSNACLYDPVRTR